MALRHKEIIMSYDKLSLASFKEALKANKYVNATGARRAVGKASTLTDSDKDKARTAIDAHFGATPAAAAPKKGLPKKAAAKKVAAKKASAAAPKKAAAAKPVPRPKAAAKKASAKAGAKKAAGEVRELQGEAIAQLSPGIHVDLENLGSIGTQMKIAEKTIQNVGAAMSVVTAAKLQYPDADLGTVIEEMGGTLSGACAIFQQVVNTVVSQAPPSKKPSDKKSAGAPAVQTQTNAQPTVPQGVVNNGVPSKAESLFKESGPDGDQASSQA